MALFGADQNDVEAQAGAALVADVLRAVRLAIVGKDG
jgi:hypothetical protein